MGSFDAGCGSPRSDPPARSGSGSPTACGDHLWRYPRWSRLGGSLPHPLATSTALATGGAARLCLDDEREGAGHRAGRRAEGHEHLRAVDRVALVLRDAREEELRRVRLAVHGDLEVDVLGAPGVEPRDHGFEAVRAVCVGELPAAEGVPGVVVVAVAVGLPEVELRVRDRLA